MRAIYTHLSRRSPCKLIKIILGWSQWITLTEKCFSLHIKLLESIYTVIVGFAKAFFVPDPWVSSDSGGKFTFVFSSLASSFFMPHHWCCSNTAKTLISKEASLPPYPQAAFPPKYSFREANHYHDNSMMGV